MIEFLGCKGPRPLIGREQLLVKWRQISRATLYHALLTQASEDKILYVHWSERVMFILLGDHSGCTNAMKKLAVLEISSTQMQKMDAKNDSQFLSYRKYEDRGIKKQQWSPPKRKFRLRKIP